MLGLARLAGTKVQLMRRRFSKGLVFLILKVAEILKKMANETQLAVLRRGVSEWNLWRASEPDVVPDLASADLCNLDLTGADLSEANLAGANLESVVLEKADLSDANL